ncbi:MAG: TolC family protein [Phycisphaerales bacterium]
MLSLCGLALVGLLPQGCGYTLFSDDKRINDLLARKSLQIGGGADAPARDFEQPQSLGLRDARLNSKQPDTTNPAASELQFSRADESRDVAQRLRNLQTQSEQGAIELTLSAALAQAQKTARELLNQQDEYILSAIRLLTERHLWDPRLSNEGSVRFESSQTDGDVESVLRIMNDLRVSQRLPYGGEVAARWVWDISENLRSAATGQYVQSSRLILQGNIPLLRGAGLIAQEGLIQAERDLIYSARDYERFRREFLVSIANDFFDLLQQQASIRNSEEQLRSFEGVEEKEKALYDAGRHRLLDLNNAANRALEARSQVATLRDRYVLAVDRFKVRLGIPTDVPVKIEPSSLDVPEPEISLEQASEYALAFRLDLQNQRDRVEDSRRGVRNARNELLPDLNIGADVTFPTDADAREGGAVYEPDDVTYGLSATYSLPLDKENERLAVRSSIIRLQQRVRDYERERDDIVVRVRQRVRAIELARFNITLAQKRVEISDRRVYETELKKEEIDTQQRLDALIDQLAARNALDQAVTDLRNAVLDYLLETGQLRVSRTGELERLPGMSPPVPPSPSPDSPPPPDAPIPVP